MVTTILVPCPGVEVKSMLLAQLRML
jgi:hypothetical protein